jgi:2-succinyl-6-hydroxy-2,4-cyclohexadiene-1-carboxylate synthase
MLLSSNGLDFHVESEGDGPPLVMLHGFTGSVATWEGVRPCLARSARVIAIDVIGHGRSAAPEAAERYTLDHGAADLLRLLDVLGLERIDLLGYSMGGRLALYFAVQHPDRLRTLVLESASPGIEAADERVRRAAADNALAERIVRDGLEAFVAEWESQPLLALGPDVPEAVRIRQHTLRLQNSPLGLANSLRGMGAGQQPSLWPSLPTLEVPVLLLVGEADARYRAIGQRMQAGLRRAESRVVSRAGHTLHIDQPTEFVRLVDAHLATGGLDR